MWMWKLVLNNKLALNSSKSKLLDPAHASSPMRCLSSHSCTKLPPDIPTLQVTTEGLKFWVSLLLSPHKSTPNGTWPWEELHWPGSCQKSSFSNHWIRDWDGGNSHQYSTVCYSWPSEHRTAAPALSTTGISALFPLSLHQDLVKITLEGEHSNTIPSTPKVGARSSRSTSWENKKGRKNQKEKAPSQTLPFVILLRDVFRTDKLLVADVTNPTTRNKTLSELGANSFP